MEDYLSAGPLCELEADGLFELGKSTALMRDNGIKAVIKTLPLMWSHNVQEALNSTGTLGEATQSLC